MRERILLRKAVLSPMIGLVASQMITSAGSCEMSNLIRATPYQPMDAGLDESPAE
jgi:hypothetical protein